MKNFLLMLFSTLVTIIVAGVALYVFFPSLLGRPTDIRLVHVSEEVPPFFELVFEEQETKKSNFFVNDPITTVRGKPFVSENPAFGPHDILGMRNRSVPTTVDVVAIGDSQTYGNNATLANNWPSSLESMLGPGISVYSMALGSFGPIQYYYLFKKALRLRPQVVIVAFYSGNDPLDACRVAYGNDYWKDFRNKGLEQVDLPTVRYPVPKDEQVKFTFADASSITLTPQHRLYSCKKGSVVADEGWRIMEQVASAIARIGAEQDVRVLFTVIPTKELVYAKKISNEFDGVKHALLREQLQAEHERYANFMEYCRMLPGTNFVDLETPLARQIVEGKRYYLQGQDGHPTKEGYKAIAEIIYEACKHSIKNTRDGPAYVERSEFFMDAAYVKGNSFWLCDTLILEKCGWKKEQFVRLTGRELSKLQYKGLLTQDNAEVCKK